MISIRRYNPADCGLWDEFVRNSRNGTFLHLRPYMDYHADRLADYSLVAADARGRWLAVMPACRQGSVVSSHAGLTFAGWIMSNKADALNMLEATRTAIDFMAADGADTLLYKAIPYIYAGYPAQEDVYALMQCGATVERTLLGSAVDLSDPIPFDMAYRQDVRRARTSDVTISEAKTDAEWLDFWRLLSAHLKERFGTTPVHSFAEISLLRSRFPENIRLYAARAAGELLGGVVVYHSRVAAHSQYTALSAAGRERRILPAIHAAAMDAAKGMGEKYFDFGTSADPDSPSGLNEGLVRQKIASGARGVLYTTYRISLH